MNQEQIDALRESLNHVKDVISEVETMIADYGACQSETSKKYLSAAIKKQVSELPNAIKTVITE